MVSAIGPGKKLGSGEQIFISYEHVPRVDFEVAEDYFYNKDLNIKPYTKIESNGILEIGVDEKHLSKIHLSCDKEEIVENTYQTLLIQQDSTLLTAKALNSNDKPVEEQDITFYSEITGIATRPNRWSCQHRRSLRHYSLCTRPACRHATVR